MFSRFRLGTRLSVAFGALLALLVGMSGLAALQVRTLAANVDNFATNLIPSHDTISIAIQRLNERRRSELRYVITTDPAARTRELNHLAEVDKALDAAIEKYFREDISDDTDRRNTEAFKASVEAYRRGWPAVLEALASDRTGTKARDIVLSEGVGAFNDATKSADAWFQYMSKLCYDAAAESQGVKTMAYATLAIGTLAALCFGVLAAFFVTRSVVRPIRQAAAAASRVAEGDLSQPIEAAGNDETADLLRALAGMQQALARVVGTVRSNADGVSTASVQIAHGNQDLSQRTEEQASALQQTAATMTQLGQTVTHNATNARHADELAKSATVSADRGGQVVAEVVSTMRGINDSSRRIADIIGTIDAIAFQTNILALNAAVEAARAGEQGRGFAVVAGEVRTLAQRSAEAAREIKTLITQSVEQVERGATLVDHAGESINELVASIRRVSGIVAEISTASAEQSRGVTEVGNAVTQMDQVTQQNAALVEESAAAAESLKQQASDLVTAMASFKLSPA